MLLKWLEFVGQSSGEKGVSQPQSLDGDLP